MANNNSQENFAWSSFFKNFILPIRAPFPLEKMLPNDMRGVILVAVALIAAVTFQAGVAPPGGVWQDDSNGHIPGRAVYSSHPLGFRFFLICNTLAFSSSIYLLLYLTFGNPFFLEVLVATLSMSGTYAAAVFSITPYETGTFRLISLVAILPLLIRPVIYVLSRWMGCEEPKNETNNPCHICQHCEEYAKARSSTLPPDRSSN